MNQEPVPPAIMVLSKELAELFEKHKRAIIDAPDIDAEKKGEFLALMEEVKEIIES